VKQRINLSIDVTKINKERLYQGQKGKYLNLTMLVDTQPDQYGNNGFAAEQVSKQESDSGVKGTILGNCKIVWSDNDHANTAPQSAQSTPNNYFDDKDSEIPF
jgi:hypothetical protein